MKLHPVTRHLAALLLLTISLPAAEPFDPTGENSCTRGAAFVSSEIRLGTQGLPVTGRSISLFARLRMIRDYEECSDPASYSFPQTVPVRWEVIDWPGRTTGVPAPALSPAPATSAFTSLHLDRAGNTTVRFTVAPDGPVNVNAGGQALPLPSQSAEITLTAQSDIRMRPEHMPCLPRFLQNATPFLPQTQAERDCACGPGSNGLRPQWVTVLPPFSPLAETLLEGEVLGSWISDSDDFRNHDSHDVNIHVRADPAYFRYLLPKPGQTTPKLEVEWERNSLPERFCPLSGDRVSVIGVHINDCGHAPYRTEIHPPVGIAVHRQSPIRIPDSAVFTWPLKTGTVTATAGTNVYVPGIATDVWFNSDPGGITGDSYWEKQLGLAWPWPCITPLPLPLVPAHIQGALPIRRLHTFHICLPRNPSLITGSAGVPEPEAPLYVSISNPAASPGPLPVVTRRTDEDLCTWLEVTVDLRGYTGTTWSRRIEAAWVYPDPSNWDLSQYRVELRKLIVTDDKDPNYTGCCTDGDFQLWCGLRNDQPWTRLLDGNDNAHGEMTFSPPWATGASDPVVRRPKGQLDPQRRLGQHVLAYPETTPGIPFWMHGFEADAVLDDSIGRVYGRLIPDHVTTVHSYTGGNPNRFGAYHAEVATVRVPGLPGAASLSAAAITQNSYYVVHGTDNSPFGTPPDTVWEPAGEGRTLAEGLADTAFWTVPGTTAPGTGGLVGMAAAFAGDMNGDGFGDMATTFAAGGTTAVRVFTGGGRWLNPEALASIPAPAGSVRFGHAIAAGDVNGDGIPDLLVGDPGYTDRYTAEGAVFLFSGKNLRDGDKEPLAIIRGDEAGAQLGTCVALVGDYDKDGRPDFAAGAPAAAATGPKRGKGKVAWLSLDQSDAVVSGWLFPSREERGEQAFGTSLANAGDVDGDGTDDLLVGAPRFGDKDTLAGAVYLFTGDFLHGETPRVLTTGQDGSLMGCSVTGIGDADGDGLADFLCGAEGGSGAAMLYLGIAGGIPENSKPYWIREGTPDSGFGSEVAALGDLNQDGIPDFGVTEPGWDSGSDDHGRASIFLTRRTVSGLTPVLTWCECGLTGFATVPLRFPGVADLNGDGVPDTIMTDPCGGTEVTEHIRIRPGRGDVTIEPAIHRYFQATPFEPGSLANLDDAAVQQSMALAFATDPEAARALCQDLRHRWDARDPSGAEETDMLTALRELRDIIPSAIWNECFAGVDLSAGAAWFIDCGGTAETPDGLGRVWQPDSSYITTAPGTAAKQPPTGQSRLTDRQIPGSVLATERSSATTLQWEVPVYGGSTYTVVFYVAESCLPCVGPEYGGTGPAGARHFFDLGAESVSMKKVEPVVLGGALHSASGIILRHVTVGDGLLTLTASTTTGGAPALRAIAVFEEPLAGTRPEIVSLATTSGKADLRILPGSMSALIMSGLADLTVSESTDLVNWSDIPDAPEWLNRRAVFTRDGAGNRSFYRARISPAP